MTEEMPVTALLAALRHGDRQAIDQLFALLYDELHRVARRQLARHRGSPTLNTTAVVHEAYIRFAGQQALSVLDRAHFYAIAARAMRQVVVEHARRRLARKRGGDIRHTLLDDHDIRAETSAAEALRLDEALDRLSDLDARLGRVVELSFYAGLTHEEIAELMAITPRTVRRDWRKARAILYQEIFGDEPTANEAP